MAKTNNHVFHNKATTIGNGVECSTTTADSVMLQFISTGTFSVKVKGKSYDENTWYDMPLIQYPSFSVITDGIVIDGAYTYEIDVKAWYKIRVEITTITGELTVYGTVVE